MASTETATLPSKNSHNNPGNNNNNNNNNNDSTPSKMEASGSASDGKNPKMLPSFSDILWCPDIDGDVMSGSEIGASIVSFFGYFLPTFIW